ncbi:MAG: DUF5916 domain-containing protein [Bacteroidales bacterium]|nr:DUF5916 domain-containing protein [Bacteroidales bacterium]
MKKLIIVIILGIIASSAYSQNSLRAYRLSKAIKIDGIFEPESWALADSATSFVQMEPVPGDKSSESTVAWFGFDENNIYAVIKCYQSGSIIARNQSRDALSKSDDLAALIIDTYNDNRTGYGFFVNPLGTQIDIKINDDGQNQDINWDTEWLCEAAEFDGGWCAEFAIPFSSIKYKKGLESWGLNFGRVIRSNFETVFWTGPPTADFRVSQAGDVTGIEVPGSKMRFRLFPYATIFSAEGEKMDADGGLDAEWQISPNVSLNATYNPDFATVEADQVKINLTRYELSYPEKRLFFQEGNGMYNTRIKSFYSRRIQDINYGARLNGKIGDYQFNALNVGLPEIQGGDPSSFFSVARIKKDILESSTVGLTMVDKSWKGGFSRSLGIDYTLNLGKTWKLTGQFIGSAPGNFWESGAGFLRIARENNIYHYHVRVTSIGENFRENVNQTGYIRDDDKKEIDFEGTYKFWLNNSFIKYIDIGSNNNAFWSQSGTLRSWALDNWVDFYLNNRFNFKYKYNNEYKLYEKDFYNNRHEFNLGYNTEELSNAKLGFTTGENFDSDFYLLSGSAIIKLFQNLSLSYSTQLLNFNPDPENRSTFINIVSANYNFNKDLWIKTFVQNSQTNNKAYLYGMFGWRFKPPFGALYLIYSHDQFHMDEGFVRMDNFFVKLTYPVFNY